MTINRYNTGDIVETINGMARITHVRHYLDYVVYETTLGEFTDSEIA